MAIKILATGDLHIGKKISSSVYDTGGLSAKDTWKRIVDWSIDNDVDIIALTGDIVDRDNRYFEAFGPLQSGFKKLKEKGIQVYMVAGNHDFDVLPELLKPGGFENVHFIGDRGQWQLLTYFKDQEILQIAGWSFPTQYHRQDPLSQFTLSDIDQNFPCIGLLHGDAYAKDSAYAPIDISLCNGLPVNLWILGHIHKPGTLKAVVPYICYPGSPMAFGPKEPGIHGPIVFMVDKGIILTPETVLFSPVRFENLEIDVTGSDNEDELRRRLMAEIDNEVLELNKQTPGISHIVFDVTLTGTYPRSNEIGRWSRGLSGAEDYGTNETRIYVRRVSVTVKPEVTDLEELSRQSSPAGILASAILAIDADRENEFLTQMIAEWEKKFIYMRNRPTYQPLKRFQESEESIRETAKKFIRKEAIRLLGELTQQQQQ